ncbi:MAG: putative membrane protein [Glaciecola sp.]|jgi:uncharacterized membrane protein
MMIFKTKISPLVVLIVVFGIVYSLISLVNHYNFRTNALDLGLYTNAMYDYTHFQWNDSSLFRMFNENLLADHFDLYLIIFSPLCLVFGTYTLLVVQIAAILIGGWGVYSYFKGQKGHPVIPALAAFYFYSFFGVFGALSYDYHSNVVAASLVPWFFYWVQKRKLIPASLMLLFILVSKENISLWMTFVCLGLIVNCRKDSVLVKFLLVAAVFCAAYFLTIITLVMPALSYSSTFAHFDYEYLGNGPVEAVVHLVMHPVDSFQTLFVNHHANPKHDYIKTELHVILLFSGLPFLLWKPQYLFMLIPIYFQKLFHNTHFMWGVGLQYNIEFAPILALGIFDVVSGITKPRLKTFLAWTAVVLVLAATIRTMDSTVFYTNKAKVRFYQKQHYVRDYDVSEVYHQLSLLPSDAVLCVHSPILPHLALRDSLYEYPRIKNAEYIVYANHENFYISGEQEFMRATDSLKHCDEWQVLYDKDITVLKRGVR